MSEKKWIPLGCGTDFYRTTYRRLGEGRDCHHLRKGSDALHLHEAIHLSDAELDALAAHSPAVAALVEAAEDVLENADTSGGEFDYLEQALRRVRGGRR